MARNEANVKFTADTQKFTAQIRNANSTLAALRAGLKLNETELKNTGDKAGYLENKYKLLDAELAANRQKQEALTQKVEVAKRIYGENSTEVQNWTTKLIRAKTEEQSLQSALNQCEAEMEEQRQAAEKLETPLEALTKEIEEQQAELERLKTEYKNVALEQGTGSEAAKDLKTEIDKLNSELDTNEDKLRKVEDAVEDSGQAAEESANGGWTVAKDIFSDLASNAIQECIEKLKEAAKETVSLGMDFTSSMSRAKALSGATDDEFSQLESTARSLGSSTIFSASQVADAFSYMALAGWDAEEMVDGIDGVLNLAASAEMDLADASDIVTDYLTAFGLSAGDSAGFVDQLAYAMANSNTDVSMLGEAYKNCAATATSMGYSVEDTTAVLMTMANAGVKGGEAGTGLSTIMTRLATNTSKCATVLSGYGVEVYDAEGNMNSLSSILNGCSEVWGTLTDEEQANLAKLIAGTSQYSKFQTVMNGLGDAAEESGMSFNDYAKALEECGGSAADMSDTMQDNLTGDIAEMKSAFEEFQLGIYDDIEEPLRECAGFVTGTIIPAMSDAYNWMKEHKAMLAVIAVAIGVITTAIGLMTAAQAVQTGIQAAKKAMNLAETATLWQLAAAEMGALAPYLLIVAAIAAVIAIIVLCVKHWDQIKEKILEVVNVIKEKMQAVWDKVKEILQKIADKFSEVWTNIKDFVQTAWDTITGIIDIAIGIIVTILEAAFNLLTLPWQAIWAWFGDDIKAAWKIIKDAVSEALDRIKDMITDVWGAIVDFLSPILEGIKNTFSAVWGAISNVVSTVVNSVKTTISTVFNTIKGVVTTVWNAIKTAISGPINAAKDTVSSVVNSIKNTISNVFNAVKSTVTNVFNKIKDAMTGPITAAKDTIKSVVDTIKGFFTNLKLKIPTPSLPKLPHFKLKTGSKTILGKEISYPTGFSVEWYSKAMDNPMILNGATIFGTAGGTLLGGGESGSEVIVGQETLFELFQGAVRTELYSAFSAMESVLDKLDALEQAVRESGNIYLNSKKVSEGIASDSANVNGTRYNLTKRGVLI